MAHDLTVPLAGGAPESICNRPSAHAVPTICPQLQVTPVNYSHVFLLLEHDPTPLPASLKLPRRSSP
jgi:hypothetical protein